MRFLRRTIFVAAICLVPGAAGAATKPKLDPDTCNSLRLEQIKFRQSGIVDDMSKGAAWGKANLSADRLREIQHYLDLDEQVQFGCRDAKLSAEAAARIEINSDADPTAPVAKDPPKPGAADKDNKPKKTVKKKTKSKSAKKAPKDKESNADDAQPNPAVAQSQPEINSTAPALKHHPSRGQRRRSLPSGSAGTRRCRGHRLESAENTLQFMIPCRKCSRRLHWGLVPRASVVYSPSPARLSV
ncbi:MAG TPA: hypothetical protein PKE16_07675 [Hyphomicrobium sp.]|nr:hypothetical protein [Hyphomicrobium sp.]